MSRLPAVHDELVSAAHRRASGAGGLSGRRTRRTLLLAAAITVLLAGTAGAVLVATGREGGAPSVPYPPVEGEERVGMLRTRAPAVLGGGSLPGGGRFELVGYRMRGYAGKGDLLCLDVVVLPKGTSAGGCDSRLRRARGTIGLGTRAEPGPKLAVGETRTDVTTVDLRYRTAGTQRSRRAALIEVPTAVAARVGEEPFAVYVGPLPSDARDIVAVAEGRDGRPLWRAELPR